MGSMKRWIVEVIGLQTSRGRLVFFGIVCFVVFLLPTHILANFSLWSKLDISAPSIGLTRAFHHVLHGNFEQAWQQNGLIFVVLLIGLPLLAKDVYNVTKKLANKE